MVDPGLRNGQVTSAERYLGVELHGYEWRAFDPVSATALLVVDSDTGDEFYGPVDGLAVLGPTGRVATLTCARHLPCSGGTSLSYVATLGPGTDEVTVGADDRTAQVIGYDGTLRRTLDLGATIPDRERVRGLRWSPDGSRLAVLTMEATGQGGKASRVWLTDQDGGGARLAYALSYGDPTGTLDASDFDGEGVLWVPGWSWSWSPDGQTLLLDVWTDPGSDVVALELQPDGADPVIARTLYHSNRHFDWWGNLAWSPDGTRIAVRTEDHITEISTEDGSVVAEHPHARGWLIWPAREGDSS